MTRFVLIDGNAILHRAFHALPPLTSPDGQPVQAVYGFTSMLLRIIHDLKPTHMAVCFDRPAPTFRKELYKKYQAHRPKMDDQLVPQVEKVHELVRSFGIPIFEKDGFEADDVIGTITSKVQKTIDQTIIVTGDRDILQLVKDDKVYVYMPTKGISEAKLYGEKETKERMGVTPEQIPDFKALAGDPSDNYPGVEGIGPKTAISILEKTHSIDNLYTLLHKNKNLGLSDTILSRLKNKKEDALMSHQLATIKKDVPLDIEEERLSLPQIPTQESIAFLQNLGFSSLLKRLQGENVEKIKAKKEKETVKKDKNSEQLTFV